MGIISTSPEKEKEGIGIPAPEREKIGTSVPGANPLHTPTTPATQPQRKREDVPMPEKEPLPV